jgi:hypothetical protein
LCSCELLRDVAIGAALELGSIARGLELLHPARDPAVQVVETAMQPFQSG